MSVHLVLLEKLNEAVAPGDTLELTRRDTRLPALTGKAHAVIGMRRAGKTTFLRQLVNELRQHAPPERSLYFSFDDDRLSGIGTDALSQLVEEYYRRFPRTRGRAQVSWFFDEVQLVPGWERFVRRLLDTERCNVVVSGSSARMLSREVHTSLRGRGLPTVIHPFSFREFLRHHGDEPAAAAVTLPAAGRSLMEQRLGQYLVTGGFPEVQGLPPGLRIELLQSYVDAVLFRDVVERYGISQTAALRWLVRFCLRNPAGAVSVHKLTNDLRSQGFGTAREAVHELLNHLTDAFLLSLVPLATDSERKRNTNPRKVYPADPGFIQAFDASGKANTGRQLEVAVFNELVRRGYEVTWVKTEDGYEVDFLARHPSGGALLLQVCADLRDRETAHREVRALLAAKREFPRAKAQLLVLHAADATGVEATGIEVLPAVQWLLDSKGR